MFCVSAGIIGLTGDRRVSAGMVGVRGEKRFKVKSSKFVQGQPSGAGGGCNLSIACRNENVGAPTILLNIIDNLNVILAFLPFMAGNWQFETEFPERNVDAPRSTGKQ